LCAGTDHDTIAPAIEAGGITMEDLISRLKDALGPAGALEGDDIGEAYREDFGRFRNTAPRLLLRPASTDEVSTALALCNEAGQPVIAQGGMTGLVDAAVPNENEIAINLERMRALIELDDASATMTVEAGMPLQMVQEIADDKGFLFPLDIGARGTCTVGGNISTNAGGNRVIRYGMMRDMVLGLEAVLADGTVISSLNKMIKNNAGYDLKHLFIGSEGTLGVVTKAVLRLRPKPRSQSVGFAALGGFGDAVALLRHCHERLGGTLSAFEAFWPSSYHLVRDRAPHVRLPLPDDHPFYVLIESMGADEASDAERFEAALGEAIEAGWIVDAVIAKSAAEVDALWAVRDGIPDGLFSYRTMLNYDVSVPLGDMDDLAVRMQARFDEKFPGNRAVFFGHIGDGNLHVSLTIGEDSMARHDEVDEVIYSLTAEYSGSISAEHGIGRLKRGHLPKSRGATELALMRNLKAALDPKGILGQGRVIG
jgi:FAD/FMN-containing dehydrogenase